ncbi:glycine betaine ABC transporter substrate-binding protein [Alteribacter natronophilus]|uniref:glycine betaine ABC transporter substrate-binding protein n=1 Tax=Alteribacter natronophilus TaxID=2583810 RepID=UPI00110F0E3E|nr:glycine betaine ABC transporter substrate-binding protein [Alteribacter natronophilus]TMW70108.1 glycine/betaine ABC transporter [Alteribacter natronophilus]
MKFNKYGVAVAGMSVALLAACGADEEEENTAGGDENGSDEETSVDYGEELDYTITGIEPGAGIMTAVENAIEEYGLDEWDVTASSSAAMTQELDTAIENDEPVIVTGWTPHWKFAAYDLKYLDDPEGVFGEAEDIHTMVRTDLESDMPEAYEVLDNFYWTEEDMGEIMVAINEGQDEAEAAAEWVENNQDTVAEWTDGVDAVDGEELELVFVNWDSEIASTNMIATVLSDLGYDVTITPTEAPYMFDAVASGEADAMVAAWLPLTHDHLVEDNEDDLVDLGANLEGARTGLVVPEYMDIDSIEDLQ